MKLIEEIQTRPRIKRLVRGVLVFLVLFSIAGFFILPAIVKSVALKQLSEKLKREVTIQSVKINPFMLSLAINGFAIRERGSSNTFVSFDELYLNLQTISIIRQGIIIKEIRLIKPYVNIKRNEDLLYNFSDLLISEKTKPSEPPNPLRFSLNNIQITGGKIDFFDGPKHTKHTIKDATLTIPFISNLPYYLDSYVQPFFSAKVNDHFVSFKGTTKPFADSIETNFDVNVKALSIPYYLAYVPFKMNFRLVSGVFDTQTSVSYVQYENRNPSLSVKGTTNLGKILIRDNSGNQILNLPQVNIGISSSDIMEKNIHFSKISMESPEFNIVREKTGKMNIQTLVPETDKEPEKSAEAEKVKEGGQAPVIEADEIVLAAGKVTFDDLAENRNFKTGLEQIQVKVNNFSTVKDKKTAVEASLQTETGEQFKFASSFSVEPLAAEGTVEARQILLKKYSPYYQNMVLFSIEEGKLDFLTKFFFQKTEKEPDIKLSEMSMDMASFRLRKKNEKEDFLKVPVFSVKDSAADITRRELVIGSIATQKGMLTVRRYPDGNLSLMTLLPASRPVGIVAGQKKEAKDEKPWLVSLKKVAAQQYIVKAEDQSTAEPVSLSLAGINFKGENISTGKRAKGKVSLSMKVEKKGAVSANGIIVIDPLSAQIKLVTKEIPVMPVQPYFADMVKIIVTDGGISSNGNVSFGYSKEKGMKVSYKGEASLNNFASVDKINAEDFLKWDSLHFSKMDIGYAPLSVNISEIALTDFYSRFIINPDGSMNVQNIMAKQGTKAEPEGEIEKKTAAKITAENQAQNKKAEVKNRLAPNGKENALRRMIEVATVTLQGGTINFSDHYIKPNYAANFLEVGGRVSGLSSEETKMADVDLKGRLDNYAPLEISGKINPLRDDLYVDLKIDFKDMDLSPITPYSGRYAGYTIEKGKLSLSLQYLIVKKKLDAQNRVFLDQLTLGDGDSPDATKLPVKLAIALLKNRKGEIDLNLPVSGQLDDPKFSLGRVIIKILVNLLVKAATSPFALLGAVFGGGEELSYLDFDYGSFVLGEPGTKKLDTLIKALSDRPALKLEIEGHVDVEKDKEGLRQYLFNKKIKAQKLKEMVKSGMAAVPVDDVKIEKDEYPKYLKMAYKAEKFPKPRNIIGIAKDLPVPEMEKLMLTHIEVKDDDLRMLASQRALTVKDYILKSKQVEPERIFLVEPKSLQPEKKEKLRDSRIDFRLK
jgi:hypothetical protein